MASTDQAPPNTGKVYLVGAGPGDPGLITVKGADCLRSADVVVYDRLVNAKLLDYAPAAEHVFAGKEPDTPASLQDVINDTLVRAAKSGKTVVRLKGGDPFVFGRGGEEVQALIAAGVPFEVVPGITAAVAVPAYAGIPVTHRGAATAFTVVSGSEDPTKPQSSLDWTALARTPGTLVVMMGWRGLPAIVDAVVAGGRPADTPAAVVQWGTTPRQRSIFGTLANIVQRGNDAGLTSPVVTVIGEVARLGESFGWFDQRPLFGKRVLVTRSRQQASALSQLLAGHGAEPVELPSIEIAPPESYDELDDALAHLSQYAWAVFTSVNGVEAAFGRLRLQGLDARALAGVRVAAVGPATGDALAARGIAADYMPATYTTSAIIDGFTPAPSDGARVLLPRADIAGETLAEALVRLGWTVHEVKAYRTLIPSDAAERARSLMSSGTIHIATFTSSSTVKNLVALLDGQVELLQGVVIASIGPVTSETARSLGLRVDVEAEHHTIPGLVETLVSKLGTTR